VCPGVPRRENSSVQCALLCFLLPLSELGERARARQESVPTFGIRASRLGAMARWRRGGEGNSACVAEEGGGALCRRACDELGGRGGAAWWRRGRGGAASEAKACSESVASSADAEAQRDGAPGRVMAQRCCAAVATAAWCDGHGYDGGNVVAQRPWRCCTSTRRPWRHGGDGHGDDGDGSSSVISGDGVRAASSETKKTFSRDGRREAGVLYVRMGGDVMA